MSDTSLTQFEPRAARILVVDDEPANLKLLSLMLRTEGYQHVELVQDPRQVLTSYRAARPDLLLLLDNQHAAPRRLRGGIGQRRSNQQSPEGRRVTQRSYPSRRREVNADNPSPGMMPTT